MIVVGLTGGIGTGKSTVARLLKKRGAVILDADRIAHELMQPRQPAWRKVVTVFGEHILNANQTINRKALAQRIFEHPHARRQLEAVIHPPVTKRITQRVRQLARTRRVRVVVLDVPLLVETGMHRQVDVLVVVRAPFAVACKRLKTRGMSAGEAARREKTQASLSAKVALADAVVDNTDGLAHTRRQVNLLWNRLQTLRPKRRGSIWRP